MAKSFKDNFNRFQKEFTINISKKLEKKAEKTGINVREVVGKKLKECYRENVEFSYGPRSVGAAQDILFNEQAKQAEMEDRKKGLNARHRRRKIPYINTGTFYESIDVIEEDKKLKVKIKDIKYPNGKSTVDVYEYLTKGTPGSSKRYWFTAKNGKRPYAHNYPTPKHEFEEHTMLQMLGYLDSLEEDIKKGNYSK